MEGIPRPEIEEIDIKAVVKYRLDTFCEHCQQCAGANGKGCPSCVQKFLHKVARGECPKKLF